MTGLASVLGVDGGGTKTEAILCSLDGRILGRGVTGPSNANFVGPQKALQTIRDAVHAARLQAGDICFAAAALCVPALGSVYSQAEVAAALGLADVPVMISGDELSTFWGALGKPTGVVVLAGTGSFASGRNAQGQGVSVGGWGPLLGDDGSGYAIGRAAIRSAIEDFDRGRAPSQLSQIILDHYGAGHFLQLREALYKAPDYQHNISALVPLVSQAAILGDTSAAQIIKQAGADLARLAEMVIGRLQLDRSDYELVLTGGLRQIGRPLLDPFERAVRETFQAIRIRPPFASPAVGALILAFTLIDIPLSELVLANLSEKPSP